MVRCRSLREETSTSSSPASSLGAAAGPGGGPRSGALRSALGSEDTAADATLYVLLRAVDRFQQTYQRFPGVYERRVNI